jgi:putative spermidine/putrescine transport system permease protein
VAVEVAASTRLGFRRIAGSRAFSVNRWALLAIPPFAFICVFFAYPLYEILRSSFTEPEPGVENYREFFSESVYVHTLVRTLQTSALVTLVCIVLAYPYAFLMTRVGPQWRNVMVFLVLVPFWTSLLIRTYGWTVLLQDTGVINTTLMRLGVTDHPLGLIRTTTGVVIGMSQILLPFMVLPLYANMRTIDPDLLRASANLGASGFSTFRRIFLPLTLPGLAAGSMIVFIYALGFYITPQLLGSPQNSMLSQLVVIQISQLFDWGLGTAMATVLLAVTLVLLGLVALVARSGSRFRIT